MPGTGETVGGQANESATPAIHLCVCVCLFTYHTLANVMYRARHVRCGANLCRHHRRVLRAEVHGRTEHIVRSIDAVCGLQMILYMMLFGPVHGNRIWTRCVFGLNA